MASPTTRPDASPTASGAVSSSSPGSAASGQTASVSSAPGRDGFNAALAQWKLAANAPLASINTYLRQAAKDLRGADDPGYSTAIGQLTYLSNVPDSNVPPAQQAKAESDAKALDTFFGTPGLFTGTSGQQTGFAAALAQWKQASNAPLAMVDSYFLQAGKDLRGADDPGYSTAIGQLTYLSNVPDSNVPPAQQAKAESDAKALDTFFGTPGLNS
ncbi:MAG TPA: hypothetical protein VK817_23955 [Trebonia sp.]|nr:hypothetical protein [Trebonia sp.]